MELLKTFYMKIGRWIVIIGCAAVIFFFDSIFPNVTDDMKNILMVCFGVPFVLSLLTINTEELGKERRRRKKR